MGFELILGGLSAVVGVIGGIAQANATAQAAEAEREANRIQSAQQEVVSSDSRRSKIREARIRRAQMIAASGNQGTGSSSGEIGGVSALGTNLSTVFSSSKGESKANQGINSNLQRAADATASANAIGAWTNVFSSGINSFRSIFD